jgi:CubicO group peptidase (beta-lactamase class C family)
MNFSNAGIHSMRSVIPCLFVLFLGSHLTAQPTAAMQEELKAIPARMEKFVDSGDLSGAVCVVGRRDGIIHQSAVGFSNLAAKDSMKTTTLFRIASMTKPITAIGIMILADEGKLNPEDNVEKYLPEFTNQLLVAERGKDALSLKKPSRPIKLRDLLTHTSGLAAYPIGVSDVYTKRNRTLSETALAVGLLPFEFEPGTKWSYSNSGIDTLGRIIEVVSGDSYEEFLKKRVFDPLGMNDTTFYPNKSQISRLATIYGKDKDGKLVAAANPLIELTGAPKHPIPAGGLVSCGEDLAKVYRMMLNKGVLNGKRILSEKAVAEMTRVQTGQIATGFVDGMGYGYGWAVVREPKGVTAMLAPGTFGHGGAFGTQGWIDPTDDVFVILLIQRTGLVNGDASPMRQALQELALAAVKKQ